MSIPGNKKLCVVEAALRRREVSLKVHLGIGLADLVALAWLLGWLS
jgi:hypothetical protein